MANIPSNQNSRITNWFCLKLPIHLHLFNKRAMVVKKVFDQPNLAGYQPNLSHNRFV